MRYALLLLLGLTLFGCASNDEKDGIAADTGEQEIYEQAQRQLKSSNYDSAVRSLQALESRYPFGKYAEQAQLELIYAHYQGYEHEAAVEDADRFIRLHPGHPNVDYAFYMKGLASYNVNTDFFDRFLPTDAAERDINPAKESFAQFNQLVTRFPDSPYAPDARARMVYLRNVLARHEIIVANYYFRRGAYMAAVNRGRYVVEHFQQTPAVPDGLAVMAQGYILLGMNQLAQDSIDVLKQNYPNYPNLDKNGNFDSVYTLDGGLQRNWINKLTFGLFFPPEPPQFDTRRLYAE